jgi:hypothetical protein
MRNQKGQFVKRVDFSQRPPFNLPVEAQNSTESDETPVHIRLVATWTAKPDIDRILKDINRRSFIRMILVDIFLGIGLGWVLIKLF